MMHLLAGGSCLLFGCRFSIWARQSSNTFAAGSFLGLVPHHFGESSGRSGRGGRTHRRWYCFLRSFQRTPRPAPLQELWLRRPRLAYKTRVRNGGRRAARAKRSGLCSGNVATGETHRFGRSILEPTITQGMEFMPQKLMILSYTMRTMSNDLRFVTE